MPQSKLLNLIRLPESVNLGDLDDPNNIYTIRKIIKRKPFLKSIYQEYYRDILSRVQNVPANGQIIELGSGGGFLKEIAPQVTTSDILPYDGVDLVFSALEMPFPNNSVSAFIMFDVLHHIKDSRIFFKEMSRTLKVGGKLVMIEPANTHWSRFIYQNFHHEAFLTKGEWGFEEGGPLSGANMAIPWIIFFRDRQLFAQEFPELSVIDINVHTPFCYLLSGGLSMKQLAPSWSYPLVKLIEFCLSPFNNLLGMFMTIEVIKVA
jgi:SAM-dependent methyltransferase